MATTRLSDVQFDEDVYLSYVQEDRLDKNAFVASGVAVTSNELQARAQGEGGLTSIPYWKDLDASSENNSSDDPEQKATPDKIGTGLMAARKVFVNNGWQAANLVSSLIGNEDPMRQIASRTSAYWNQRFAARIQAITLGIYNENAAGDEDMIFDASTEDADNATADNKWTFDGFVDARATMGEHTSRLALLGVHPDTMTQMIKQEAIEYVQESETGIMIPTYNGYRVVEDKNLPVIAGTTSGFKYVSVLYRQGVIGYGSGTPRRPVATEFDEAAGNGAGIETLWERKEWLIHPEGYKFTDASVADDLSPTVAEHAMAANWERKFQRENIGMAFFVHN